MRKALISPTKYVQGENELLNLGYFVKTFGEKALLIANQDDVNRVREKLEKTAAKFGVEFIETNFHGEASRVEASRLQELAKKESCDCIIGLGGGKAIDTSKVVAEGKNLIIVPTIVATDAPTSHSAVLYTEAGEFDDYAYFMQSPSVVLIDTTIIAQAPTQFLVSGMGDALSTYFEARATSRAFANVNAGLPCGAREGVCPPAKSTNTALALAKLCYETLLEDGYKAKESSDLNVVTPALENIIEANILLSGLGFESGGLAAIHAIHDGLTILHDAHGATHGEKVAFGVICQLILENAPSKELYEVLDFSLSIGLPVCLEDIGVKSITDEQLTEVAEKSCIPEESIHSMPFKVDVEQVKSAIMVADALGRNYKLRKQAK
ncbi:glycerol dehydrogenase [Listeria monocytogenes]|nr:glycerol dehydrogenase [Listeria monocytogenes]EAD0478481.1 glycerol dehydrogenase [Listeria monocytogenes]EAE6857268.1 glycerol dehydrogenase [Listeria monocytogenes]EAE6866636.1 glycerol dehydrogenase [Listeria monocytogenes]EAE6909216.1 glycerol dehydrogenase [Listeria monocytogenes]